MDTLPSMSEAHYSQAFQAFGRAIGLEKATPQRIAHLKDKLPSVLPPANAPLRILSIGAGTGYLDIRILKAILIPHSPFIHYDAIEPNLHHLKSFAEQLEKEEAAVARTVKLHNCTFEEFIKPEQNYDLVIISHSLYYLERPSDSIVNLFENFLPPSQGALLILHSSPAGTSALQRRLGMTGPRSVLLEHALSGLMEKNSESSSDGLAAVVVVGYLDFWVDLEVLYASDKEERLDLLSFFVAKDLREVESELVDKIHKHVEEQMIMLKSGRRVMWQPEAIAVIRKS